tara:strand:+ start:205 stop:423 length:219 start_codon:yes stop_codon:yes gene_type:complete
VKIETKEQLLAWIEEVRKEKGVTANQAAIKAEGISQSQWYRFIHKEREPTWDHLYAMAKSVGIRIHVSARLG